MLKTLLLGFAGLAAAMLVAPAPSAVAQGRGNNELERFLEDLDALIDEGERRRRAEPGFIRELRGLMRRRAGTWIERLLVEEFRDGNLTRNPPWVLAGDPVDLHPGEGLILEPGARAGRSGGRQPDGRDFAGDLLGALLGQGGQGGRGGPVQRATGETHLSTRVTMPNAFAISVDFTSYGRAGVFEFGVLTGDGDNGYRVVYRQDSTRSLELVVFDARGSSLIDAERGRIDLEDGIPHEIQFTRDGNGEMVVRLDRAERMRVTNRAHDGRFQGFILGASGDGRFGVDSVTIYGGRR